MPYTQNEINEKLIFLIEPEFKKAERFEQKPNRTLALGTIEELFGELTSLNHFHILLMNSIKNIGNLKTPILNFLSTL